MQVTALLFLFVAVSGCTAPQPPELLPVQMACQAGEVQACEALQRVAY